MTMYFLVKDCVCWRLKDWWYWKMDIPHFPASNFYKISFSWFGSLAVRKATYVSPTGNFHIMPILNASCEGFQIPTSVVIYHAQPHHPMLANLGSVVESRDWFGLEGTRKIIQFQPPCCGQGHLSLFRLLKGPSTLALNISRDKAATISLANLF